MDSAQDRQGHLRARHGLSISARLGAGVSRSGPTLPTDEGCGLHRGLLPQSQRRHCRSALGSEKRKVDGVTLQAGCIMHPCKIPRICTAPGELQEQLGIIEAITLHKLPRLMLLRLAPAVLWLAAIPLATAQSTVEEKRFFEEKVRPLLARHCLGCHNNETGMSGLSLESRESALLGGERGPAVVPGEPGRSLLIQALRRTGELKMPPAGPLQSREVEVLTRWVQAGAPWGMEAGDDTQRAGPSHWSFQPPRQAEPPPLKDEEWVRSPIDRFVLARLEASRILPSPEADRRTLIRRVSLDLIGLPPTPREIAEFLADTRPVRLRAPGESFAGFPPFRGALGTPLARHRSLCRLQRLLQRRQPPHVEIPRLGDQRAQPGHALRPLCDGAARR